MNDTLIRLLERMSEVKLPQKKYMISLFLSFMCFCGKATYRNLSRYGGCSEKTISRWSKREFDYSELNRELINSLNPEEVIGVIDASFLDKSGKQTEGLDYFWDGTSGSVRKGLEITSIGLVDTKRETCFNLFSKQTIVDGTSRILQSVNEIKKQKDKLKELKVNIFVADGYYAKRTFVDGVIESGFNVISKFRCDANFRFRNDKPYTGRGRPRKYGNKVNMNELSKFNHHGKFEESDTEIYSAELYSVSLKNFVRVVVLKSKTSRVILFSTDLNIHPPKIIEYYRLRFQIEFMFRDAKQHLGLGDCMARSSEQINNHINTSFTALNLLKLEDANKKGSNEKSVISIANWKRRYQQTFLVKIIFQMLDIELTDIKLLNLSKELDNSFDIVA